MNKYDRIVLERKKAVNLFDQNRSAEGRLKYELLLDELMPKPPKSVDTDA